MSHMLLVVDGHEQGDPTTTVPNATAHLPIQNWNNKHLIDSYFRTLFMLSKAPCMSITRMWYLDDEAINNKEVTILTAPELAHIYPHKLQHTQMNKQLFQDTWGFQKVIEHLNSGLMIEDTVCGISTVTLKLLQNSHNGKL